MSVAPTSLVVARGVSNRFGAGHALVDVDVDVDVDFDVVAAITGAVSRPAVAA